MRKWLYTLDSTKCKPGPDKLTCGNHHVSQKSNYNKNNNNKSLKASIYRQKRTFFNMIIKNIKTIK